VKSLQIIVTSVIPKQKYIPKYITALAIFVHSVFFLESISRLLVFLFVAVVTQGSLASLPASIVVTMAMAPTPNSMNSGTNQLLLKYKQNTVTSAITRERHKKYSAITINTNFFLESIEHLRFCCFYEAKPTSWLSS
jgi:hypothetical protein